MLGKIGALALMVSLATPVAAVADEPAEGKADTPDTTEPVVPLDPCPDQPMGEACTRREVAAVWQMTVDPAEGLAVAGVRTREEVLSEHVYDDGSGFTPYGLWGHPYSDVVSDYDYVNEIWLAPGLHELTFFARDVAGNEATFTRTVHGPEVPSRPRKFSATERDGRTQLSWVTHGRGSGIRHYVVRVKGEKRRKLQGGDITLSPGRQKRFLLLQLDRGRHVVRIQAVNGVGKGEARSFVFRVR
ncbi:fibronectin type III domain-containing protein [Nocardioides sp. REDSEA-S30_B4]|jgi:hypothetical protein|uniref:fibronectin type III domain-containing protein n=1 Tax=Nocardioides sp. REDSEA-S30_B4 TaxID=1811552 RepID=UPI000A680679|nr:fibronectin type III domain-containing protein [Nocardioides sp. REDSEA-S30_B4]